MADSIHNGSVPPAAPQGASVAATLDALPPSSPSEAATLSPLSAVEMPNTLTHVPEGTASAACEPVMPTSLPGYEILEEMGRGGMGVVYKARQCHLNRLVALKMILAGSFASADQRVRFLAEAETIAQLRHPYIVQVYDFNQYQGNPYFALEYLEGGTLEKKLAGTPLPPRDAALMVKKLAEAVQSAHDKGIIHRDLKPANVLLDKQGEPKLTDFGLAKHSSSNLTASGAILGTPSYMAPEQAGGKIKEITVRTDVYALGAILYECLTGRPPFRAHAPFGTMVQVLEREPAAPRQLQPHLPRDLETICLTCLRKEPAKRYESAKALAADLQRFLAGEPIHARRTSRAERTWRWCKRNPVVAGLMAAVAVLLLSGTVISSALAVQSSHRADEAVREKDRADAKTAETVREKERADDQARAAQASAEEARKQEAKARASYKRRQDALERLLLNLDGRLARYGSDISSVRLEFLQEFLKLGQELMEDNQKEPSARLQMAQLHRRIGEVWAEDTPAQAEKSYRTSLGLLEKLIADYPKEDQYRDELGYTLARQARALRGLGRAKEAEQAFNQAATLQAELAAAHPDKEIYLMRAAYYRWEMGDMLESNLDRDKAKEVFRQALAEQERVIQKSPKSEEFVTLSRIADSLGTLLAKKNPAEGKPFMERRLTACREAKQREPSGNAGQRLQLCYFDLGEWYLEQGWHEALRDLSLAYGKDFPDDPDQTYNAACLMTHACAAAKKAEKTPGPLTEQYARQAMDLLRKAAALGYRDRLHLDRDPDLAPLRGRTEYQAFCAELDKRYPQPPMTPARELQLLEQEVQEVLSRYRRAQRGATTVAERQRAQRKSPSLPTFVDKYLAFAEKHRQAPEAITALLWIMETTTRYRTMPDIAKQREKALALLERDHLQKPEFLQVCQKLGEDPTVDCQSLLRAAVAKHSERDIRAAAGLVLADALAKEAENKYVTDAQRGAELAYQAEQQLEQLLKDYPEVVVGSTTMRETAQDKLFQLRNLSVGRVAPEITGNDLEGKPFKLSDYRGKIVVIDFWANWCGWCREMYPHSRHMVDSLKDKPFALLGVNNDDNLSEVKKVVSREKLSWRSWWDGNERIRRMYQISSWPTIYVLDAKGVIRYKGLRGDKLENAVQSLLKEMETAKKPGS